MAYLDKVRFVAGDEGEDSPVKVWQGYDAASTNGSAGFDMVYVTADTLRAMADFDYDCVKDSPFDRLHNAPEGMWERLAFGGEYSREPVRRAEAVMAPDGVTPLYLVGEWTITIVQRFNPDGGRRMDVVNDSGVKVGERPLGVWENVEEVTGIPEPVGFIVNPQDLAEGRTDTPPFERYNDDEDDGDEPYTEVASGVSIPSRNVAVADDEDETDPQLTADQLEAVGISPNDPTRGYPVRVGDLDDCEMRLLRRFDSLQGAMVPNAAAVARAIDESQLSQP